MGRFYTVTNSNSSREGIKKRTISRQIVIGPNAIKFITITIAAVLALVYLTQSTSGANRSVQINELESSKSKLELRKEQLEVEKCRLKSLKEIDSGVEKKVLEPVSKVDHIGEASRELAKNNF